MPGETPSTAETTTEAPPDQAGSFPEPVNGDWFSRPPSAEGVVLEPVDWKSGELPPAPELLATPAQPEGPGQVFEPTPPEEPRSFEAESEPAEDREEKYSAADGWKVSGKSGNGDRLILKRDNPHFQSGVEVKRVKPSQYQEAEPEPAIEPEARPAPAADDKGPEPPEPAEASPEEEQSRVLVDQEGKLWSYKGQSSETGMHKIESLTENHTKFLTDERMTEFSDLKPEAQTEPQAEHTAEAEPAAVADPEKEHMRDQIHQLSDRIAKLESMLIEKESPYEIKVGGLVPVYSWAKGFESARILEEGDRDGESFYKVMTAEGETRTLFKDEVEYWFSHRAEPEAAPKTKEEAQKRFSQKFKSVRSELKRLGGKAKDSIAETATPHIEAGKEALGTSLMMGQVVGEKISGAAKDGAGAMAGAAKEGLSNTLMMGQVLAENTAEAGQNAAKKAGNMAKETVVYPWLTGQVVAEKTRENLPAYRRRLIGRAAGYAAVFSVWLLGPSEVKSPSEPEDNQEEKPESAPLAA